ncbi:MAG: M36 family metallopeptidase [Bacteroidota bacterium]
MTNKFSFIALVLWIIGGIHTTHAQIPRQIADQYLNANLTKLGLTASDIHAYRISDSYTSQHNGLTHIYLQQQYQQIDVHGAHLSIHIQQDEVVAVQNRFIADLRSKVSATAPGIPAKQAIDQAIGDLNFATVPIITAIASSEQVKKFAANKNIQEDITAQLVYYPLQDGTVQLAWQTMIVPSKDFHHWRVFVDAKDGSILKKMDEVHHCRFDHKHPAAASVFSSHASITELYDIQSTTSSSPSYQVWPYPVEDPNAGSRALLTDPSDSVASPFGWHDDDGLPGHEYTITRGNNVWAQENHDRDIATMGYSPDGDSTLLFDFPYNSSLPTDSLVDATVTNLFYWNNLLHDIFYQYGFDEVSGNFQANNYGRGGIGGDHVLAFAQDSAALFSASFIVAPDGTPGKMRMGLFPIGGNTQDGSLDNGIIAHEYGHGISERLAGGPSMGNCLSNIRGEAWSDFIGLVMTSKPGDTGETPRGFGRYVQGTFADAGGFRDYPFSTDMSVNPLTYKDTKAYAASSDYHGLGTVLGATMWDMYWALIDQYGLDSDLYRGTGGNNIALQLVIDGLKLQGCNPGFLDVRDAILLADQVNNGSANQCLIWEVFARRGMGFSATQGDPLNLEDHLEAFDLPLDCRNELYMEKLVDKTEVSVGDTLSYTLNVINLTDSMLSSVLLEDTLPPQLAFVSGSDNCGALDAAGVLLFQIGNMMPDQTFSCSFQAVVKDTVNVSSYLFRDNLDSSQHTYTHISITGPDPWRLDTLNPRSGTHAFFVPNKGEENDQLLTLPPVVADSTTFFYFWHYYNTESEWDGGFVEVFDLSTGNWIDLGPFMVENGYNNVVGFNSPVGARAVFGGNSHGYIQTKADLRSFAGKSVRIRFRFVSDQAVFEEGWYIDDFAFGYEHSVSNRAFVQAAEGNSSSAEQAFPSIIFEGTQTTSIGRDYLPMAVSVYPNPTEDLLHIRWDQVMAESVSLRLYALDGRLLQEQIIPPSRSGHKLSLQTYPSGMYVLLIGSGERLSRHKVIKE